MNTQLLRNSSRERIHLALDALRDGRGVLVLDKEDRENEVDLVFPAETITEHQVAQLIYYGSGIVCLCLSEELCDNLGLKLMVPEELNGSQNKTAYTITIEAAVGVTTGVSAHDRLTTIKAAINPHFVPGDLHSPGHVFPLRGKKGGVLVRGGHTEASIDLATLAGFKEAGVIAELTNPDGTMVRLEEALKFQEKFHYPLITIEDLKEFLSHA